MNFIYPWVLWGLGALAIPLIVHLFNFRRTKKVFFSNVAFLKKVETQTSSFRKLKQWLIMAARMAAIAALVVAFAQPFFPAQNNAAGDDSKVKSIYLDNSLSMQNAVDNQRFIDLAVIELDELLGVFGNSVNLQFLDNDFSGLDRQLKSGKQVQEDLTSLDFSLKSRSLQSIYKRQATLVSQAQKGEGANLFWISDFQKSTAGNIADIEIDSVHNLYVIPLVGSPSSNVFVDSVWTNVPFIREMQNNVLKVKLVNSGNKDIQDLPVKLTIDDSQSSGTAVNVPAGGEAIAEINFTVKSKGEHRGMVSFEDQPITFDNTFFFTLTASPSINVLHLYQEKAEQNYVQKLFQNDSLFDFRSLNSRTVDFEVIKGKDLVVLEGIANYSPRMRQSLATFTSDGGSVVIIPHSANDSASLSPLFSDFGLQLKTQVAPEKAIQIDFPDTRSGFFKDVFDTEKQPKNIDLPSAKSSLAWMGIGESLLQTADGKPFLAAVPKEKGKAYFFSTPFRSENTSFAEHALFVPSFLKMAALSVPSQRLAYQFGDTELKIELPAIGERSETVYKLVRGEDEIIPSQRIVNGALFLTMPTAVDLGDAVNLDAGYYDLTREGTLVKTLAFNNDNTESYLDNYTPAELQEFFNDQPNVKVFDGLLESDFVTTYKEENIGKSLWTYFLWAALAFLLIEILLVRFMKG